MSKIIETGHHKNLGNLNAVTAFLRSYKDRYNPQSSSSITLSKIAELEVNAADSLNAVKSLSAISNERNNERMVIFKKFNPYLTRILGALEVANAPQQKLNNAKTIVAKARGVRISAPRLKDSDRADADSSKRNSVSVSQQSFDSIIEHAEKMLELINQHAEYAPNETELTASRFQDYINQMRISNNAVKEAFANISNARLQRNQIFYHPETGLVRVAMLIKKYLKQVYTATGPEFLQVNAIPFKTIGSGK